MKVLTILADSLALVRPEEGIRLKDLYSYKLQERFAGRLYVINRGRVGNHSRYENDSKAFVYHISAEGSPFFCIHLGIVDCTPRLFSEGQKVFLSALSGSTLWGGLTRAWIRSRSNRRYELTKEYQNLEIPLAEYESNMRSIVDKIKKHNPVERIFIVNIAQPGPYLSERNYGIERIIAGYNEALRSIAADSAGLAQLIDVNRFTRERAELVLADGHHISPQAHDFVAREIGDRIGPALEAQ